ncbi:hypothetical protein [Methanobacterium congolense]|jgi:hypothetical protein|uniref:Uncharacterized protein n=1 Tax=Methanobacterium congolense TaxID=118062 RepID=A0A1D3L320_9EURY|nr:hypothetical protein [Methanobacterium congolense]SCG86052.1 putative protein [Methanobacterium congolense]
MSYIIYTIDVWGGNVIDKIEINMMNGVVHNFKRGEFGVESIEIDDTRGFIEISYGEHEMGSKMVIIPLQNVEKCEFTEKYGSRGTHEVGGYVG